MKLGERRDTSDVLYYILYDLREHPFISEIHLPSEEEEGPVLLLVNKKDYPDISREVQEMNENEGFTWMTSMLWRPEYAPTNTSDLLTEKPYILIAHTALLGDNPEAFMDKITGMQKWVTN